MKKREYKKYILQTNAECQEHGDDCDMQSEWQGSAEKTAIVIALEFRFYFDQPVVLDTHVELQEFWHHKVGGRWKYDMRVVGTFSVKDLMDTIVVAERSQHVELCHREYVAKHRCSPSQWTQNLNGEEILVSPSRPLRFGKWLTIDVYGKKIVLDERDIDPAKWNEVDSAGGAA